MECSGKEVTKEWIKLDWEEKVWGNRTKIGQKRPVTFKQVSVQYTGLTASSLRSLQSVLPSY